VAGENTKTFVNERQQTLNKTYICVKDLSV